LSKSLKGGGRHILVSGGSRGLGQAIVETLLESDYRVSTISRKATRFTDALEPRGDFYFHAGDVADVNATAAFVSEASRRLGRPYGLINCAGVAVDGVIATMPDEQLDRVLSINLAGAIRLTRQVVRRLLLSRDGGVIVNISSIIGVRGYSGLSAYAATKGGLDAVTRTLARELGPRKIRVNSVAPGYLETEMTHGLDQEQRGQIVRRTPMGRLGTADDVVGAVLFLLSDAASFMTGQILVVDGGITT
jgi:3-oxoacyl-[acyl-carrier protein] reductase